MGVHVNGMKASSVTSDILPFMIKYFKKVGTYGDYSHCVIKGRRSGLTLNELKDMHDQKIKPRYILCFSER